jgi:hypothetical protein
LSVTPAVRGDPTVLKPLKPLMDEYTQAPPSPHRPSPTRCSTEEVLRILQWQRVPAAPSARHVIDEEEDVIEWQCHHSPNILPHSPGAPQIEGMVELLRHDHMSHQMKTSNMRVPMLPSQWQHQTPILQRHSATTHRRKWGFLPRVLGICAGLVVAYIGLAVCIWLVTPLRLEDAELALIRLLVTLQPPQLLMQSRPQPKPPHTQPVVLSSARVRSPAPQPHTQPLALSAPRVRSPAPHNPLPYTLHVPAASPRDAAAESRPKVLLAPTPSSETTRPLPVTASDELTGE